MGPVLVNVPAGWYPDPSHRAQLRWWDGQRWTDHTHDGAQSPDARAGGDPYASSLTRHDAPSTGVHGAHGARGLQGARGGYGDPSTARALATPDGQHLGSLGFRLLARLVDGLLISVVVLAATWEVVQRITEVFRTSVATQLAGDPVAAASLLQAPGVRSDVRTVTLVLLVVSAVYTVLSLRLRGATPGKALFRLRVRHWERPGNPTWLQALLRWATSDLLGQFLLLYALLDYLWPCWDRRKQALHDKLAGTVVVRKR